MSNAQGGGGGGAFKPSKLNKILAGLWCGALLRKGPMCCTTSCSCFNDVENPDAQRARAEEARWKYRSEKLAYRQEKRAQAAEKRADRRDAKRDRRQAKADSKAAHKEQKAGARATAAENEAALSTEKGQEPSTVSVIT
jgi:hypothetical protein